MSKSDTITEAPSIDPAVELAAVKARLQHVEALALAGEAAKVKGHRSCAEIKADIDAENAKYHGLLAERDKQHARHEKEMGRREGLRQRAKADALSSGQPFDEAEFMAEHGPVFQVDAGLSRTLHKQHYVIARFEKEMSAMLKALGPEYGG